MEEQIVIPYVAQSGVILPKFVKRDGNYFIYSLFSPEFGDKILPNHENFSLKLSIHVPLNINCYIKRIYVEEKDSHVVDLTYDKGMFNLTSGNSWELSLKIPQTMNILNIKRGDVLAFLLFDRKANFQPYTAEVQTTLLLKFERLSNNAFIPFKNVESAGYDISSAYHYILGPGEKEIIRTDLAIQIPPGFYGKIEGRSGLANEYQTLVLSGVIDPGYRGNIFVNLKNLSNSTLNIVPGDRIAQLIIQKFANCFFVESKLDPSERGTSCLGSSGLNSSEANRVENKTERLDTNIIDDEAFFNLFQTY